MTGCNGHRKNLFERFEIDTGKFETFDMVWEAPMNEISIEDGTINYEGEWLGVDDLTLRIQEKMSSNDMKFAGLASALEELKQALESAHTMEVSLTLSMEDYNKLMEVGGGDDAACVMKAVKALIGESGPPPAPEISLEDSISKSADVVIEPDQVKMTVVKCSKCKNPIEVPQGVMDVECPNCGTSGRVKSLPKSDAKNDDKGEAKHQDHFIG